MQFTKKKSRPTCPPTCIIAVVVVVGRVNLKDTLSPTKQLVLFLNKIKEGKDKATLSRRQRASYKKKKKTFLGRVMEKKNKTFFLILLKKQDFSSNLLYIFIIKYEF